MSSSSHNEDQDEYFHDGFWCFSFETGPKYNEPKTNGHTEPTRQPITNSTSSTLSKGEEMLVTGIWTRSVTSNKTPEQVAAHADAALAYMKKLGGNDEPFNDQF